MRNDYLYTVITGSVVSEKSTMVGDKNNQYVFKVIPEATKEDVKAAVELLFQVPVVGVQMVNIEGKKKRSGRSMGKRNDVRKAYVRVAAGKEINFAEVK